MLMPASRRYCTHPALWVPFEPQAAGRRAAAAAAEAAAATEEQEEEGAGDGSSSSRRDAVKQPLVFTRHSSVAIVAVADKRPALQEERKEEGPGKGDAATPSFKRLSGRLMADSLAQQEAYASFWGYDHVLWEAQAPANGEALAGRPVAWGKLLAIREALKTHEYALYLDLDLAIIQPMLSLDGFVDTLLAEGKDLLVAQDGNGVNTGVMLFRRSPWSDWFLGELWRVGAALVACDCIFYYEQRVLHHALQTPQWQRGYRWWTRHIPVVGWFRNPLRGHPPGPTLEALPLLTTEGRAVTDAAEVWEHVALVPQCAFNAVESYTDAEFIVHFAGHKGRRKERLMAHFGKLAAERMEGVAKPLRARLVAGAQQELEAGAGATAVSVLPLVWQTWKTHADALDEAKRAWHESWRRNGFRVALRNDTECLADVARVCEATGRPELMDAYQALNPVQRADFWRYAITYLEGGIYSDIDIGATPETARFFLADPRFEAGRTALVGIVENAPYDNPWGRLHWRVGMSPMYSRVPQLRQSFFYARQGHPHLLRLLLGVAGMVRTWEESGHTDIGNPRLGREALQEMEASGALTLEMTGPGVWTDYMLAPVLEARRRGKGKGKGRRRRRKTGQEEEEGKEEQALAEASVLVDTMEGYSMIRYGSMGSWKTAEHKADLRMWRNILLFYSTPFLLALLFRAYRRYQRHKRAYKVH
jgi:hypothetical protein